MCGSMADIQSAAAEIRRGKKKKDRKNKPQHIWSALFHRATINKLNPGSVASYDLRPENGVELFW